MRGSGGAPFRRAGWRALGAFWAVILAILAGGAVWLEQLGPPPPAPPVATATADGEVGPSPPPLMAPPIREASVQMPGPSSVRPSPPSEPPLAPEPPPLVAASTRGAVAVESPIPAPDPALLEWKEQGSLPRVAANGRTSIQAYARRFDGSDSRPRVAVVVADIGLSAPRTEEAIRRLPPAVALALSPYAPQLHVWAERARERGMETLVGLPLEPAGYPLNDAGDKALLTGLPLAENLDRLDWALMRFAGYVGAIGTVGGMRGERAAQASELIGTVQDVLRARGLLYIDPRPGAPPPARAWGRSVDIVLDEPATRGEIERRLEELERLAQERGSALGLAGAATPVVLERLAAWAAGLEGRGLVLAPVTAVIRRPLGLAVAGDNLATGQPAASR